MPFSLVKANPATLTHPYGDFACLHLLIESHRLTPTVGILPLLHENTLRYGLAEADLAMT
jgi:hypothetical protein